MDWKEPSPEDITKKVLEGVKSGSIMLFHNDLENTTQALPDILTQLRDSGYSFVTVSELIYHDDYTINSDGMQVPQTKAGLDINADNVDEVMAQYSDEIRAAGFTDEQLAMAAEAIKSGAELPEDVKAVIADFGIEIPVSVEGIIDTAKDGRAAVDTGAASGDTANADSLPKGGAQNTADRER